MTITDELFFAWIKDQWELISWESGLWGQEVIILKVVMEDQSSLSRTRKLLLLAAVL